MTTTAGEQHLVRRQCSAKTCRTKLLLLLRITARRPGPSRAPALCRRWALADGDARLVQTLGGSAHALSALDLSDCRLDEVPSALVGLPALRVLLLHGNPRMELPAGGAQAPDWLPRLATLSADWTLLRHAPPRLIQSATALTRLALLGREPWPEVVRALRFMPQLEMCLLERSAHSRGRWQTNDWDEVPVEIINGSVRRCLLEELGCQGFVD